MCRSPRPSAPPGEPRARRRCYASWNGATQVASWKVLGGPSASRLTVVASAAKSGFETAIALRPSNDTFEVEALNANHQVIGTSAPFAASR